MFDEVMGLGDFADSSRGSATSSKSGQDEAKEADETAGQEQQQPIEEEESNGSRPEEKMDEGVEEPTFPSVASPSSDHHSLSSSFKMGKNETGGGGSGGAAFDDALDGLPSYGPEEEDDEDWHFALPMGTLEEVDVNKANQKRAQSGQGSSTAPGDAFAPEPREEDEEEEQEREGSSGSANTSHSSRDHTPENSQGNAAYTLIC